MVCKYYIKAINYYNNYIALIGEACGEGTLIELQDLLQSKKFEYSCYNIYGDLNDEKQSTYLSMCASHVVRAIQKGIHLMV